MYRSRYGNRDDHRESLILLPAVNKTHSAFIALGSNLGDRLGNLQAAIGLMPPALHVKEQSPIYETSPWGYADQPDFLNQVVHAETDLAPLELLAYIKSIEVTLGRTPTFVYGPRQIDLDILFYDDLVLQTQELIIPHPHLASRAFVLCPLADIAPDLRHPIQGQTVLQLLEGVDRQGIRMLRANAS